MTRIERSLAQALGLARGDEAPPSLLAAMRYAVFPGGARIRPRLCLGRGSGLRRGHRRLVRRRRRRDRVAALRFVGSRRLAVFRRRRHPSGPALGSQSLRRAHRRAYRGCVDRAVLPGARSRGRRGTRAAGDARWHHRPLDWRAQRHHRRSGLGMRAADCSRRLPARQDRLAVRGRDRRRRLRRRTRGRPLACARRAHRRGLPDCRRHSRRASPTKTNWASLPGRDQALGRPNAVHRLGIGSAVARLEDLVQSAIEVIPACPGAADLRAHILGEASRLLPRELARPAA